MDSAWLNKFDQNSELSIEDFIEFVCANNRSPIDGHWAEMDYIVPKDIQFDFVGKLEQMAQHLPLILEGLKVPEDKWPMLLQKLNQTTASKEPVALSSHSLDLIYKSYSSDFSRFDYPKEPVS